MMFLTAGPDQTLAFGREMGRLLRPGDNICLNGDLGAGKTLLVQGIAAGLDIKGNVTSPTFTILNVYEGPVPVHHFDLYRLDAAEQLDDIGFDEYTSCGITIIEWSDKFPDRMPDETLMIEIAKAGDNDRLFSITPVGQRYTGLCEELTKRCSWLLIQPR